MPLKRIGKDFSYLAADGICGHHTDAVVVTVTAFCQLQSEEPMGSDMISPTQCDTGWLLGAAGARVVLSKQGSRGQLLALPLFSSSAE